MTPVPRRAALWLFLGLAGGCEGTSVVGGPHDAATDTAKDAAVAPRAGLVETGRGSIDLRSGASPHLGRLVANGPNVYVANSFDGVAAFRVAADGRVALVKDDRMAPGVPRCTTLALHAASSTLFCAAADRTGPALGATTSPVAAYRLGGPDAFALRDPAVLRVDAFVAALHVHGDRLLLAAFDRGLLQARIASDGSLGALVALPGSGDAVALASAGDLLAQIDRDAGLRLWRVTAAAIEPWGEPATLEGPPLAVTMDGPTVGVALGSQGAAVYAAGGVRPTLLATLRPPCAAVSIALRDAVAAVGCMDGIYLYAWREAPPRLRGFVPTVTASLDVAFTGDALVASDWSAVAAYRVDGAGESVCPLLPRGRYVRRGLDVTVPVANPGPTALHLAFDLGGRASDALPPVTLAPGASIEMRVPAGALGGDDTTILLRARSQEEQAVLGGTTGVICSPGATGGRAVLQAVSASDESPAIGQAFPALAGDPGTLLGPLPLAGRRQLIVFNNDTCIALWPELQDLAWIARHPPTGGAMPVVLVTNDNPTFVANWRLQALGTLLRSDSYTLYERHFRVERIPGPWHTEYFVDAQGVVQNAERVYAGPASPVGGFRLLGGP
jgi:hypothetical protein